jgi:hypothetical protein
MPENDTNAARDGLKHLQKIEDELGEIRDNTGRWGGWFFRGVMQGAGIIVGTIAGVVLFGWLLSILGFIPGFGDIAEYLRSVADRVSRF